MIKENVISLDPSSEKKQVLISLNPKAGRTSPALRAEEFRAHLEKRGFPAEILTDLDLVARKANELHQAGKLRALVGVGGDGTAAELTNRTLPGTPITLLPAGTANLIAKEFRLPFSPGKAAEMIETGSVLSLDAGRANGRLFLVMVSAGIDAEIVERVHRRREENYRKNGKKGAHISYLSYLKPIFSSIRNYRYPLIDVQFTPSDPFLTEKTGLEDEKPVTDSFRWVFVFNLPRYGWGVPLVPDCVGNDRRLDLCGFKRRGLIPSLMNVGFAQLGSLHRFLPNARLSTGTRFLLSAKENQRAGGTNGGEEKDSLPEEPMTIPFQLDGDPGGILPVEIEIVPDRFHLLVPDKTARRYLKLTNKRMVNRMELRGICSGYNVN